MRMSVVGKKTELLGRELVANILFLRLVDKFGQREESFIGSIYYDKRSKCTHLFALL